MSIQPPPLAWPLHGPGCICHTRSSSNLTFQIPSAAASPLAYAISGFEQVCFADLQTFDAKDIHVGKRSITTKIADMEYPGVPAARTRALGGELAFVSQLELKEAEDMWEDERQLCMSEEEFNLEDFELEPEHKEYKAVLLYQAFIKSVRTGKLSKLLE